MIACIIEGTETNNRFTRVRRVCCLQMQQAVLLNILCPASFTTSRTGGGPVLSEGQSSKALAACSSTPFMHGRISFQLLLSDATSEFADSQIATALCVCPCSAADAILSFNTVRRMHPVLRFAQLNTCNKVRKNPAV